MTDKNVTTQQTDRHFNRLVEAALNLGMSQSDAVFYARQAVEQERLGDADRLQSEHRIPGVMAWRT